MASADIETPSNNVKKWFLVISMGLFLLFLSSSIVFWEYIFVFMGREVFWRMGIALINDKCMI